MTKIIIKLNGRKVVKSGNVEAFLQQMKYNDWSKAPISTIKTKTYEMDVWLER